MASNDDMIKLYHAIVWLPDTDTPGQRVSVYAKGPAEAMKLLELEYGEGNIFNLHNEEDAERPRGMP
jgi:hypothetical protein